MSIRIMTLVWELNLPDSDKLVLLALADCANDEGYCWPGMATLSRKCSKSERTIQYSLRRLVDGRHLSRREIMGRGCEYMVHPRKDCTPAETAPVQGLRQTPATVAPKPSVTVIKKKDKPSSRARSKPKHSLPANWEPKELTAGTICAQIVAAWQPGRIERELSKFRDHHLKTDAQWSCWDAAWRTWIQRASDFERPTYERPDTNPLQSAVQRIIGHG